jgi:2-polyprenyl-3-methyl-5-hydroxy-6-metoxy-1,4-benzoquinol methylase
MREIETNESAFHNEWAKSISINEIYVYESFESQSSPENFQILSWMGNIKNKKILELGCGLGEASTYFAIKGAQVTATDISPEMINKAVELASFYNVKIEGRVVSSNSLENIEDLYYDFIYAGNLLHHVEIEKCVSMLSSKLKVGGTAFFWDPIAYNPVINIYRKIAKSVRTPDEHPLTINDVKTIKKYFSKVEIKYFWLLSMSVFLWYYFIERLDPNKTRYWKQILKDSDKITGPLKILRTIDSLIFKYIPPMRWLAWNIVIRASK